MTQPLHAYRPLPEGYGPGLAGAILCGPLWDEMKAQLRAKGCVTMRGQVISPTLHRGREQAFMPDGLYLEGWLEAPDPLPSFIFPTEAQMRGAQKGHP